MVQKKQKDMKRDYQQGRSFLPHTFGNRIILNPNEWITNGGNSGITES